MSDNQPTAWLNPRFKTATTPDYLCKLMPDRLVGQKQAMEHFYNKFKIKAEEGAKRGDCSYTLEITDAECGTTSDFDVQMLLDDLHSLLKKEGFISVKKELTTSEMATLEMAWKAEPKPTRKQAEEEKRQLSTVPMPGGYNMNQAMVQDLMMKYQQFAGAQGGTPVFYPPQQYPWGWSGEGYAYSEGGYSSPNPNATDEEEK